MPENTHGIRKKTRTVSIPLHGRPFKENETQMSIEPQGCIQDFCQGGGELGVCQKEGGEAVRSCRAAAGGWVQEGDVPPPAQNVYLSEIHLHEL